MKKDFQTRSLHSIIFMLCLFFAHTPFVFANTSLDQGSIQEYKLTDAKHVQFKKENADYALADTMLNFTWYAIKDFYMAQTPGAALKNIEGYQQCLQEQRIWLETTRDEVASSFSMHLSEAEAFTLAIIARTQELASRVYQKPTDAIYLYANNAQPRNPKSSMIQGGHIAVNILPATAEIKNTPANVVQNIIIVSGQSFAKNGNACDIYGETILEMPYNAQKAINNEDPIYAQDTTNVTSEEKGWLSFSAEKHTRTNPKNEENPDLFFVLFTPHSLYVVHGELDSCNNGVACQGMYRISQ